MQLLEESLVVLLEDVEHALHERLPLRHPHGAHVHLLVPEPAPPAGCGVRFLPHQPRAQALERRQPLHRASSSSTSSAALRRREDEPEK
jgi:hypothetical protein